MKRGNTSGFNWLSYKDVGHFIGLTLSSDDDDDGDPTSIPGLNPTHLVSLT